jgi:tetratricopeptide (TPR) repeat protein
MNVEMEVQTEGNPEFKNVDINGKDSSFSVETFGRPKPNGIILDPHNYILKSSQRLRVRGIIARGETLAEQGRYYDAVQQYQRALELDRLNALADFRMGEAFFYQRNYAAAAQSFRDASEAAVDATSKWTEVWSHIYLGRIFDIQGDRTRAVNEYSRAKQTGDDTGGAQAEAEKSLKKAYAETGA